MIYNIESYIMDRYSCNCHDELSSGLKYFEFRDEKNIYHPDYHSHYLPEDIFAIKICLMIIAASLLLISITIFILACWILLSKFNFDNKIHVNNGKNEQIGNAERSQSQ